MGIIIRLIPESHLRINMLDILYTNSWWFILWVNMLLYIAYIQLYTNSWMFIHIAYIQTNGGLNSRLTRYIAYIQTLGGL